MEVTVQGARQAADSRIGTRFWIYPQAPFVPGYEEPERIWLPILPDEISPGPSDVRMYVVDPLVEKAPYGSDALPPFEGLVRPPVLAGPDRNFDYLDPSSRAFLPAHAYACVNFVLAIWESYLGHRLRWFFAETFQRLEIVTFANWKNAQAGYGFLELGFSQVGNQARKPLALNFDTIAHETGHLISLSEFGPPPRLAEGNDFYPFSEAFSDLVSLISFLYFDTALDRLLRRTRGNLMLHNELNRFAETSPETQIRLASNSRRMSEVTAEVHDRSLPFIGAVFDSIVEFYQHELVRRGVASPQLLATDLRSLSRRELDLFQELTSDAFAERPLLFKEALSMSRDVIGQTLANALTKLEMGKFNLSEAADAVSTAATGPAAKILAGNFAWREIT